MTIQLHSGWGVEVSAEQDFEMPLGSRAASTTVDIPTYDPAIVYFWWDVWVDGVKDDDLSVPKEEALSSGAGTRTGLGRTILVPGPPSSHRSLVTTTSFDFEVLTLKLADFPRRWIEYSCLDVIALSTAELQQLSQQNSAAFTAMSRWVRTGGELWVCDVGNELESLPAVCKLLQMPDLILPTSAEAGKDSNEVDNLRASNQNRPAANGWGPQRFRRSNRDNMVVTDRTSGETRVTNDPQEIAVYQNNSNYVVTAPDAGSIAQSSSPRFPQDSSQWFVEQRFDLGLVRAFRGPNEAALFSQSTPIVNPNVAANSNLTGQIPRVLAIALRNTRIWENRHGMVPDSGHPEFAKLLVPGVGLAPVTQFQILISLFVVLIGPFNYWILKRFKRLHLLVLTVPLAAGATTAALFAYAILADGFATTVRAHSFTTLDQRTGEAACWARLSYYSGLAPGRGLTMPADVVVYPILPSWSTEANRVMQRSVIWEENEASLTRGWLNSRTPTQYLTLRARKSPNRLNVQSGGGKAQVTNRLGTTIRELLLVDEAGDFYSGAEIANDATVALQPTSRTDAAQSIGKLVRDNQPEVPVGLVGGDREFGVLRPDHLGGFTDVMFRSPAREN